MSIYVTTLVWKFSKAEGSTLLTALAIADHADDDGRAYPSIKTLAKKARTSERTVQYALATLKDFGELIIEPGTGPKGTNTYCIQVHALRGANSAGGVQNTTQGGATHCTQTIIEPSSSTKKNKGKPAEADPPPPAEWISAETWALFAEHRRGKKAKLTSGAVAIILKTLTKAKDAGLDPNELLETSVANGWTGVFLPKVMQEAAAVANSKTRKKQGGQQLTDWMFDGKQGAPDVIDVVATQV